MGDDVPSSDHDLLITMYQQIQEIKRTLDSVAPSIRALEIRSNELEEGMARHSERLTRIREDVNSLKQDKLNRQEIESLKEDINNLKIKSNAWDFINSIGIAIVTILEIIFRR